MTDADFEWHYREVERHRNEAIEECARAIEDYQGTYSTVSARSTFAAAIRALKDKP